MPKPTRRVPDDPGKPTPREALAKATAAAGPRVAKAVEAATPKVEKAALTAGRLLGTLRDRARTTAKEFTEAYRSEDDEPSATGSAAPAPGTSRPRPRPHAPADPSGEASTDSSTDPSTDSATGAPGEPPRD